MEGAAMNAVVPMTVPLNAYLAVGTILFVIGLAGALLKRNTLSIFLSIELMMNAVNLLVLAYARRTMNGTWWFVADNFLKLRHLSRTSCNLRFDSWLRWQLRW